MGETTEQITVENWHLPRYDEQGRDLRANLAVRFIGGKHNGMKGNTFWVADTCCSVRIEYDHKVFEVVEEFRHLIPLALWVAGKSEVETSLRGEPIS